MKKINDEILAIMMELQMKGNDGNNVNDAKNIKCVSYLTEPIKNMHFYLNDKSRGYRYSQHITNTSILLYS